MLTRTLMTTTASLLLLLGSASASQQGEEREEAYLQLGPLPFEVLDLNGDGIVTADEHAQVHRERFDYRSQRGYPMRNMVNAPGFDLIDADHNGSVSREELTNWRTQRMSQRGCGWRTR
ncbi:MAG: hypothetical protein H6953_10450 [Chromatiaceae bacterium]|nr:hypothetical protein [Gammaproteobacteria bacterium]MCP5305859.1 hypothetical protein [Chromatiaceae bacterium]MCP5312715.1 hypothetical protein [Chromatiaceae bacterium]